MALSQEDQDFCRELGEWFYGSPPHTINNEVAEVLSQMLGAVVEKSKVLDMVPRPTMSVPGIAWLVSEAVKAAFRTHKAKAYDIAVKTVALQYRSIYEMAQLGV